MDTEQTCEGCGSPLKRDGVCPACLLAGGMSVSTPSGGLLGTELEGFTIIDLLGEGGMGKVYLAEQHEPIIRDVALKLIKRGMDTEHLLRRFEQERRTLARMEHPGIARILDAGEAPDGRPFFVMELVDGIPITHYASREKLDLEAKLQLLLAVCEAVQHAHQKGVMHRDLKPSNILVEKQSSGEPVPKVIDFGLAKATEATGAETMRTRVGQVLGTPAYMSPEQSSGAGDVDTRTDVYALGAILYELLIGKPPPESAADGRRPSDGLEHQAYPIDLDWIILKALATQPTDRYQSVGEFASDLHAFLEKRPVAAAQPLFAYRLRRFSQRYRKPLIGSLVVLSCIALGLWQAWIARRSQVELGEATQRTHAQTMRAELVGELFYEVFSLARRENDPEHDEQMVRLLKQFSQERLGKSDHLDPYTALSLRHFIGFAFMSMRHFDEAEKELKVAEKMAKDQLGLEESDPLITAARVDLVGLLIETRQFAKAERFLKPLLASQVETGLQDSEDTIHMQKHLGRLHFENGQWEAAIAQLKTAYQAAERLFGPLDPSTIDCQRWRCRALIEGGYLADAQALHAQTLATARSRFGDAHPITRDLIADGQRLKLPQ